jgi:adenylate kinase
MSFKQILFLGAPGVGKGTYAKRVAPILGYSHLSPGDLLRREAKHDPSISEMYLDRGILVPESLVFTLVEKELNSMSSKGVILDGFPRSATQATSWIATQRVPDLIIEFHLPRQILVNKLLGRRICGSCGDLYNVFSFCEGEYSMPAMNPQQEGICDNCGGNLIRRSDDNRETIESRLDRQTENEERLMEVLSKYTNNIRRFDVKTGIAQVSNLVDFICVNSRKDNS